MQVKNFKTKCCLDLVGLAWRWGWPGGGGLGLVGVLPMRSQVRIRSGANNSLEPSDLDKALDLTVVHLWETCLPRPCAPSGLVRPSGLDTRG
uniref:Uncharacterized protein n=1 Tax=Salix viminalis TaxID=40686 RepID=A0A6N2N833_SALVM